ncbi:Uncharacterised protein [Afipia felis]|jgi:hypothetical protein|uniref:Uncharacterized protein n=2 Tax=Afipia felis TaxID=1035 RepID=A0A380WDI7_AFIFE|nr:hypothetical protein HMPREF9697_02495 [Afipia felis ATCC 53690]SUU78674.1 Uncharacterised protein [Afipia felis]SUU86739.1 Uncharacterised protein [Afipia felis]
MWENNTERASRSARLNVAKYLSLQVFNARQMSEIAQDRGRFQPQCEKGTGKAEAYG